MASCGYGQAVEFARGQASNQMSQMAQDCGNAAFEQTREEVTEQVMTQVGGGYGQPQPMPYSPQPAPSPSYGSQPGPSYEPAPQPGYGGSGEVVSEQVIATIDSRQSGSQSYGNANAGGSYGNANAGGGAYGGAVGAPAPAPMMPNPFPAGDDCEDCGELVQTTKTVQVPCTRNTCRQYTVKVPRQVTEKVARQVKYVDYEDRDKTVNYTVNRCETRYKDEQQCYTVPVEKMKTRMVSVVKKVPKTIYVDVTVQEPQTYKVIEQETRQKMVKIPYTVNVPHTMTKVVKEKCPVEKVKTVFDDVCKTVFDTEIKTECRPVTKMIAKQIPVYHWRQKAPQPCAPCQPKPQPAPMPAPLPEPEPYRPEPQPQPQPEMERVKLEYEAPAKYDTNNDGVLDEEERKMAARDNKLVVKETVVGETLRQSGGSAGGYAGGAAGAAAEAQMAAREEAQATAQSAGAYGGTAYGGGAQAAAQQAAVAAPRVPNPGPSGYGGRPRTGSYGGTSGYSRSRPRSRSSGRKRTSRSRSGSKSRRRSGRTSSRRSSSRRGY